MIRFIAIALLGFVASIALAKDAQVKGAIRKNGTYVPPHHRTTPNATRSDNYSSKPNINPYTGKPGQVDPAAPKPQPQPPK